MKQRAIWLSFWMTMVYWLGGAFGCSAPAKFDVVDLSHEHASTAVHDRVIDTEPSLKGLDRSHWAKITVQPADGVTQHGPIIFKDSVVSRGVNIAPQHEVKLNLDVIKLPAEDFSRVHRNAAATEQQLTRALDGYRAQNWSAANRMGLVMQPIKMTLDLVSAPIRPFVKTVQPDTDDTLIIEQELVVDDDAAANIETVVGSPEIEERVW